MGKYTMAMAAAVSLLVVGACQTCLADYSINLIFQGGGTGSVKLQNGGTVLLNSTGPPSPTAIVVSPGLSITATGTATKIGLTTIAKNVVQNEDLEVVSSLTRQSELVAYERSSGGTTYSTDLGNDVFLTDRDYTLNYTFELASNSAAQQYQYYFNSAPDQTNAALNEGSFYTGSATDVVPWAVISSLGIGANRYGILRVIDFGGRFADSAFEFNVSPAGPAVPEPSSLVLIGTMTLGLLVRRYARRKKE
jgi:hypothetical protein